MNKLYTRLVFFLGLSVILLSGCSDVDSEITGLEYDRLFSPTDLTASIRNKTSVKLSWNPNNIADSYNIEITAEGADAPFTTKDVTNDDIPITISGLKGETTYTAKVKATSEKYTESKWSSVTFTTDAEQIFQKINSDELKATEVTLRWPAGEVATTITLTPGDITHTVTADEIAAGAAKISGLTSETEYTAKLLNGTRTRGTISFTTLIDLNGAIAVYPESDFEALIAAANDNDVFALFPGTYGTGNKFIINKSIALKAARPNNKPIINGLISIQAGNSLEVKEIVFDGTNTDGSQAFTFNTSTPNYGDLKIDGCEIKNYVKGLIYLNVATAVESVTVNNCIIHDITCSGGDFIDSRAGAPKAINVTNSTVYNSVASRDFIRVDDKSSIFAGVTPSINVDHCTLYGVSNSSSKRLLYVRFKGNTISFTNNIVAETRCIFSNQKNTAMPTFSKNNYSNAPGLFTGGSTSSLIFDDSASALDPGFSDAANGNFKISQEDIISKGIGDPRWLE
ncbi:fibronectin type III domain-containing protein [uncultured Bacteroides sp.]|uniref:fibronectin type III domain-containing protein n=1 Tax=uncultured Bacteroides sp. TaxID=162156 RepID=UPI002AABF40E|nr:fibronectin type III domain-containing protein [uncultured Bacteroides sp.]